MLTVSWRMYRLQVGHLLGEKLMWTFRPVGCYRGEFGLAWQMLLASTVIVTALLGRGIIARTVGFFVFGRYLVSRGRLYNLCMRSKRVLLLAERYSERGL